jgi:hypothetical protein
MATAFFPQGMESYNNTQSAPFTAPYKTWKGDGIYSNPVGITPGNIRPLTNKDYTNIAVYKQGAARPQKWQFRRGTVTQVPYTIVNPNDPSQYITVDANRMSKSTAGLENKTGGLVGQLMDRPGGYSVKQNTKNEINETTQSITDCKTCDAISVVTNYYPSPFLTNNPQPVCTNPPLCCNEPRKALLRVRPASTNLKKNYFTTLQQYRENRCQTYEQRAFNFKTDSDAITDAALLKNNPNITPKMLALAKPGSPLTTLNTYVGNCYPNTGLSTYTQVELVALAFQLLNNEGVFSNDDITNFYNLRITTIQQFVAFISDLKSGDSKQAAFLFSNFINNPYYGMALTGPSNPNGCKLVVYKPNNPQFAVQGAVSSSARTLKLGVTTIETNVNNSNAYRGSPSTINPGQQPFTPFIYKSKVQQCSPVYPIIFRQVSYNPKTCFKNTDDAQSIAYQYNGAFSAGPTVASNGISASNPGGQPIR